MVLEKTLDLYKSHIQLTITHLNAHITIVLK
jgi:hypothetical protein